MRSILGDLEERLAAISTQRRAAQDRYEAELRTIERDEKIIKEMLAFEQRGEPKGNGKAEGFPFGAANEAESEMLAVMSDGKDWDHAEIKARVPDLKTKLDADDTSFGRKLHGMLMSMRS